MLLGSSFLRRQGSFDSEAQSYINAVEAADGQPLESEVKTAINNFVVGCKTDGIWNAIKCCVVLAGARTLSGALIPLVGNAPTNFNFVSADYNRKLGLKGNGSSKYLNSNRPNNADPQNSKHVSVFVYESPSGGNLINSGAAGVPGRTGIGFSMPGRSNTAVTSINHAEPFSPPGEIENAIGNPFMGLSRSSSSVYTARFSGLNNNISLISGIPNAGNISIFARMSSSVDFYSTARISFYSIGESINLTLLDSRVTTLMNTYNSIL